MSKNLYRKLVQKKKELKGTKEKKKNQYFVYCVVVLLKLLALVNKEGIILVITVACHHDFNYTESCYCQREDTVVCLFQRMQKCF